MVWVWTKEKWKRGRINWVDRSVEKPYQVVWYERVPGEPTKRSCYSNTKAKYLRHPEPRLGSSAKNSIADAVGLEHSSEVNCVGRGGAGRPLYFSPPSVLRLCSSVVALFLSHSSALHLRSSSDRWRTTRSVCDVRSKKPRVPKPRAWRTTSYGTRPGGVSVRSLVCAEIVVLSLSLCLSLGSIHALFIHVAHE